jgi:hypothetical protein
MDVTDVSFDAEEGVFRAPGSNVVVTLLEAAEKARGRGQAELTKVSKHETLPAAPIPTAATSPRSRSTGRPGKRRSCATPSWTISAT